MSGLMCCAGCGLPLGPDMVLPSPAVLSHVVECDQHPLGVENRRLRRENERLRGRLRWALGELTELEDEWTCVRHHGPGEMTEHGRVWSRRRRPSSEERR